MTHMPDPKLLHERAYPLRAEQARREGLDERGELLLVHRLPALDETEYDGTCHCGGVRFHVHLDLGLRHVSRCTCSICRMHGAIVVHVPLTAFTVLKGTEKLVQYRFNSRVARHYFCSVCGVYTHHQRRTNPNQYSVNIACLQGISPFDFPQVAVMDGIEHPCDAPAGNSTPARYAGVLHYVPASDIRGE